MGYFTTQVGTVTIAERDEAVAVEALKALNHNHEDKRGGSFGAGVSPDPYESKWYSWLPSRYHEDESLRTVGDVLEMVGYEVSSRKQDDLIVYTLHYDNKTGQEDVFLSRLSDFAVVDVSVTGEDGARWRWANDAPGTGLLCWEGSIVWDRSRPVVEMLYRDKVARVQSI